MSKDNRKNLQDVYNTLKKEGYTPPEYDVFEKDMENDSNLRGVYESLKKEGYTPPEYDVFKKDMGFSNISHSDASHIFSEEELFGEDKPNALQATGDMAGTPVSKEAQRDAMLEMGDMVRRSAATVEQSGDLIYNLQEYGRNLGQTKEVAPTFNASTGKMEKSYITPFGNRYKDNATADKESRRYRMAADMSVGGQLRRAYDKLAELEETQEKRKQEVHENWEKMTEENNAPLKWVLAANTYVPMQKGDKEHAALDVAIHNTKELIKDLEEQKDREGGIDVGYWRGVGREVKDSRNWDFGVQDLLDVNTMLNADKMIGESATEGQRAAYNAMMGSIADRKRAEAEFSGNASGWNKFGRGTGKTLSFVADFGLGKALLSGGIKAGSKWATRNVAKAFGKEAIEEMVEKGFRTYVKEHGVRGLGRESGAWAIKALGTTFDDVATAGIMTNTVQAGKTMADIGKRKLGDVSDKDKDGVLEFENDKSWAEAIYQGEGNAFVENLSEMSGEHIPGFKNVAKALGAKRLTGVLSRLADGSSRVSKIVGGTKGVYDGIRNYMKSAGVSRLLSSVGIQEIPQEISEEYIGQLARTVLNLDDAYIDPDGERKNLLLSPEFHSDLVAGTCLTMGFLKSVPVAVSSVGYMQQKHRVNKADGRAMELLGKETWEPMREMIDMSTNENIGTVVDAIKRGDFTDEEKDAAIRYTLNTMVMRGYNLGEMARKREQVPSVEEQDANQAYIDGYNAKSAKEMADAKNMYELQRNKVRELVSADFLNEIDKSPVGALSFINQNENWTREEKDAVIDYVNAKQVWDGMVQRVRDDIDGKIGRSDAMIMARTNHNTDMVVPAVMKTGDRQVYVVAGNVVAYEDGTGIDLEASDGSVVVRDAETGKLEQVSPGDLLRVDVPQDPFELQETAAQAIREEVATREAGKMDGVVSFNAGDVYTIAGADGSRSQVTVVADGQGVVDNGDGTVNVSDGQQVVAVPKESIQQSVGAENMARVEAFEAHRKAKNAAVSLLDEAVVVRNDDGSTLRGVVSEVADDYVVVQTYNADGSLGRALPLRIDNGELTIDNGELTIDNGEFFAEQSGKAERRIDNGIDVPNRTDVAGAMVGKADGPDNAAEPLSALGRIPKDEQGMPLLEQTDAETAWDGVVEYMEDTNDAEEYVKSMVSRLSKDAEKARKAVDSVKSNGDMAQFKADKGAARQALADTEARLSHWQQIAETAQRKEAERAIISAENEAGNMEMQEASGNGAVEQTADAGEVGQGQTLFAVKLNDDEAALVIAEMENGAETAREMTLNIENWDAEFGEDGRVSTPIGDVKMGENQFLKMMRDGRNSKLGMIKPTLTNPDIIMEEASESKEGETERNSSYVFAKAFKKADGGRYYYFTSVTVRKDGMEVVVSSQEKSRNRILRLMTENGVVWRAPKDATSLSAEEKGLDYVQPIDAEAETKGSGITPQSTISDDKVTESVETSQENGEENAVVEEKVTLEGDEAIDNVQLTIDSGVVDKMAMAEAETKTNPTDAQRVAENEAKKRAKKKGKKINLFSYVDKEHPVRQMHYMYHDPEGFAVVSDGRVLVADKSAYDAKYSGKMVDKNGNVFDSGAEYPKWKNFVPTNESKEDGGIEKLASMIDPIIEDQKKRWHENGNYRKFSDFAGGYDSGVLIKTSGGKQYVFNAEILKKFVDAALHIGATDIEYDNKKYRAFVARGADGSVVMMMPKLSADHYDAKYDMGGITVVVLSEGGAGAIPALTEEEYLALRGYGFEGIGEPALNKGRQKTAKQQDAVVSRQLEADRKYILIREELRKEYREKLQRGELRKPTTIERLISSANGHPDLESTKAAERALLKRGYKKTNGNWKKEGTDLQLQVEESATTSSNAQRESTDAVLQMLAAAGIEVSMDEQEMAEVLEANEALQEMRKSALETVSAREERHPTVVSSADGTKILKKLQTLAKDYEEKNIIRPISLIGDVAEALGMKPTGRKSQYGTFEAKNGKIVTIRLSDHNSTVSNYDNAGVRDGISIIVTSAPYEGIANDGDAHVTEVYYNAIKLRKADGKPLAEIIRGIEQALYSGEYRDTTGLAEIQEVNPLQLMTVYHGSGAAFDAFDHSHMGEGEGAQAYGWGTYVTEVEGIARTYASATANNVYGSRINRLAAHVKSQKDFIKNRKRDIKKNEDYATYSRSINKNIRESEKEYKIAQREGNEKDMSFYQSLIGIAESQLKPEYHKNLIDSFWNDINNAQEDIDKCNAEILQLKRELNKAQRNLYTVDIPDDNGGNYLEWDKAVDGETLEKITNGFYEYSEVFLDEGIKKLVSEHKLRKKDALAMPTKSGEELYRFLQLKIGSDREASLFLNSIGVVGIKYPAQYQSGGREDNAKNYVIFNEADAKITERIQFLRTGKGEVYGFVKDGKIYLDPKLLNPNTPIHEYTHMWDMALQKSNPELWARGVELMKQTALWNDVVDNAAYADIAEDDNLVASEVHARLTGKEGAALLEKMADAARKETNVFDAARKISLVERLRSWIRDAWLWVKDTMTPWTKEEADVVSLEEFVNMPVADLARGIKLNSIENGEWRMENSAVQYRFIGEQDAAERAGRVVADGNMDAVNERFNEELSTLTEENADSVAFDLGRPSAVLRAAGVEDMPMKLYGNKVIKKMKKHGFSLEELRDLPRAVANPIAVFNNYQTDGNRSILTELRTAQGNFLVTIDLGKDADVDFNIISSVFGKGKENITDWINKEYGVYYNKEKAHAFLSHQSAPIAATAANAELVSAAKVVENFENPKIGDEKTLQRGGDGAVSDGDVIVENDPVSKWLGVGARGDKKERAYMERMRRMMRNRAERIAKLLGIEDMVTILEDGSGFEGRKAKAKGFFDRETGKITVIIGNHSGPYDVEQTMLHEAVAHYGLRKLFGGRFDTFLDNVFNSADADVRRGIVELSAKHGWNFRTATEEYLAGLAEDTRFEDAMNRGWWQKIKSFFMDMLKTVGWDYIGPELGDNELRYILWRSYENLKEPGLYRSILGEAADVAKQYELGVGNYAIDNGQWTIDNDSRVADGNMDAVNERFNEELSTLTEENADSVAFDLGRPSAVLRAAGVEDMPMKLYGNKVIKKMKKHGFSLDNLRNLPKAVANPIAVFNNYNKDGNRSVLTELHIKDKHILVSITIGKDGVDADFNIISSVFGKGHDNIVDWINKGYATYLNKEKTLDYLHFSERSISEASNNQELVSAAKVVENFENPKIVDENRVLYRAGESEGRNRAFARQMYEERVSSGMYQSQEAMQDSMLGLEAFMHAVLGEDMPVEDVAPFENAYLGENSLSSRNMAESEAAERLLVEPLLEEVAKLAENDEEYTTLVDYMLAKHGLERNRVMAEQAAWKEFTEQQKGDKTNKPNRADKSERSDKTNNTLADLEALIQVYRKRDFAGLTALTKLDNVAEAETQAEAMVREFEEGHDTKGLWEKVRALSQATLSKQYECGMMGKETYKRIAAMYEYYIPLRGFDEKTSDEAYAYLLHSKSAFNAPIKKAFGRKSKADDPFANLTSMMNGAIVQGNRNRYVKQRFLNFVLNHPSDLASVSELWIHFDEALGQWVPMFPNDIEDGDTAEEVELKVQAFEERMRELAEAYPDNYKRSREAENIPYRVVEKSELREHQVVVKRNGRDYVITINGSPRAAQAVNGQTNPDNITRGVIGSAIKAIGDVNRFVSSTYTTWKPDFVVGNLFRDVLYANTMVWIKESANYAMKFHKNHVKANPVVVKRLFSKYRKGELDIQKPMERMFHEFMMNGGETGYTAMSDVEAEKKKIKKLLKQANEKFPLRKLRKLLYVHLAEIGSGIENSARFAAFMTSREMGRTIDRSIYDAKEISVNFNKKGAGDRFFLATGQTAIGNVAAATSGAGRAFFVFWNAALQGTFGNFGKNAKRHPKKTTAALATMFLLGALPVVLSLFEDDDDEDKYENIPDYTRRTNLIIKGFGKAWIKYPLPIEYRAVYGLGEMAASSILKGEEVSVGDVLGQFSQVLPIDMLSGQQEEDFSLWKPLIPSSVKPIIEAESNVSFVGLPIWKDTPYNQDMPQWTKSYKSTNRHLVKLTETLNAIDGDKYTKGTIDLNPAKIEYILNGYVPFWSLANQLSNTADVMLGQKDFDWRYIPFANRILLNGDERTEYKAVNEKFFRLKDEYEKTKKRLRGYEKEVDNGVLEYAEKINFLYYSPEYARYEIYEEYREDLNDLRKEIKEETDDEVRRQLEAHENEIKKELIKRVEELDNSLQSKAAKPSGQLIMDN